MFFFFFQIEEPIFFVIDARPHEQYMAGHLEGSYNLDSTLVLYIIFGLTHASCFFVTVLLAAELYALLITQRCLTGKIHSSNWLSGVFFSVKP